MERNGVKVGLSGRHFQRVAMWRCGDLRTCPAVSRPRRRVRRSVRHETRRKMPTFCNTFTPTLTRRDMLRASANGFGLLALAGQLQASNPLAVKLPHFAPKAKRVIFLFMHGGPSQVDTFDPKPLLKKHNGQPYPGQKPRVQFAATGNLLQSPWDFKPGGKCGIQVSDLFPEVRKMADELCVIRSIHADNSAHGGALLQLHTGQRHVRAAEHRQLADLRPGHREPEPARLHDPVPDPRTRRRVRTFPARSSRPRSRVRRSGTRRSRRRTPPCGTSKRVPHRNSSGCNWTCSKEMNQQHLTAAGPDAALEGRIQRLRAGLPDAGRSTRGHGHHEGGERRPSTSTASGTSCRPTTSGGSACSARRLAEAGVRFVQCTHSYKWDQHGDLRRDHAKNALEVDRPIAALLADLKRRGLLKDTLVWWGGEFGRTPDGPGRGRPRPQPARLQHVAGRRRGEGRGSCTGRPTTSGTTASRTRSTCTTYTRRSWRCWAWTTRS